MLKKDRWSPYLVGALIGTLLTGMFLAGGKLGASTGIARIGALLQQAVAPAANPSYFHTLLKDNIVFNTKILFLIGLFFGALLASKLSREATPAKNTLWKAAFGNARGKRYVAAFFGGLLLMFGARIADGCTSGHAITGGAQFSITSWAFMLSLFATAIPTSFILYKRSVQ